MKKSSDRDDYIQGRFAKGIILTCRSFDTNMGTVSPTDPKVRETGTSYGITANPKPGYKFVGWYRNDIDGVRRFFSKERSVVLVLGDADETYDALFEKI